MCINFYSEHFAKIYLFKHFIFHNDTAVMLNDNHSRLSNKFDSNLIWFRIKTHNIETKHEPTTLQYWNDKWVKSKLILEIENNILELLKWLKPNWLVPPPPSHELYVMNVYTVLNYSRRRLRI